MSPKRQRLVFVLACVIALTAAALFTLQALKQNIVFFFTPSELVLRTNVVGRQVRLGGLVEKASLEQYAGNEIYFYITDNRARLKVHYKGALPALFREGQGVVAEGKLEDGIFQASMLLAKHDEKYMPKVVADEIKARGEWRAGTPTP